MVCQWNNWKELNQEDSSYCYKHNEVLRERLREKEGKIIEGKKEVKKCQNTKSS